VQFSSPAADFVEDEVDTFGKYADHEAFPRTPEPVVPLQLERELRIEEVTFRYPTRQRPAIDSVSLHIKAGESFGIVGPTGSGKSTLLDVILGMLEPDSGAVFVDDLPLAERRDPWQRTIGYVPQDVYLIDDTLRANVALGWYGEEIDEGRVLEAIGLAGLDDVVVGLPNGVETILGERGVRLSGGQRQRIAIARAFLRNAPILILDEATSDLDAESEFIIQQALADLMKGRTVLVIAHRLATVRRADRIVVIDEGRIVDIGRHEELLARDGLYRRLHALQMEGARV